ncbi:MAG: hypothetical protein H3C64_04795 [Candidatus Kuenenia stuttgartiensis]|nr:hypothetical protein [Candidatus Kuenenia stuttgartiensis]
MAKELSANTFNDYWNNSIKPIAKEVKEPETKIFRSQDNEDLSTERPHPIFEIDLPERLDNGLIDAFGGLFMFETQGEDYEELEFANRMKKKKKRKKTRR